MVAVNPGGAGSAAGGSLLGGQIIVQQQAAGGGAAGQGKVIAQPQTIQLAGESSCYSRTLSL